MEKIVVGKIYKREKPYSCIKKARVSPAHSSFFVHAGQKRGKMKRPIKVYLDSETEKRLLKKANETGFNGRGAMTKFMEKIASEDICFLDDNLRKMLKALFPGKN